MLLQVYREMEFEQRMKFSNLVIFIFFTFSLCSAGHYAKTSLNGDEGSSFLRVCYYSYGDPPPKKINGTLCTHIIKGFTTIMNGTLYPGNSADIDSYIAAANLKILYPHLKMMMSIGGGGNDGYFSEAMKSYHSRKILIESITDFLIKYNYDGLDVDWEFPGWPNFNKDRRNFVLFLKEFRKLSYFRHSRMFLLSVAVAGPKTIIDASYDIPNMARYVDFINLMSYDYHDYFAYTPFTGHNSPLFKRSVEKAYFATLNTAWSSTYWNQKGMPLNKILVGLPTYGHSYKLFDASSHDVDSLSTGVGINYGSVAYPDVCNFIKNGATVVFDNESKVPYTYKDLDWISYENLESLNAKMSWIKSNGFGGVMTFDLNCDDWAGICDGKTKFPLHQLIYDMATKN